MSEKILLVDDEEDFLETVDFFLTRQNFSVVTAVDGEDALRKMNEQKPDLVLLDIMMPVLDGLETCRRLKGLNEFRSTPVIILTAKGQKEDIERAKDVGADDFIVKPFDFDELLIKIVNRLKKGNTRNGSSPSTHKNEGA